MCSKKLEDSFILEELSVAIMGKKIEYFATSVRNAHTMFLCLLEIIMLVDCSCFWVSKEMICAFCNDLKEHLNYVSDKNDLPF